jgi:uncharacterized protein
MKIIVDTNVLVSAVLKGREPRAVVQFIIDNTTCDWIVTEEILAEYKEVLSRSKFKLTSEVRLQWLEILDTVTTLIEVNEKIDFLRDKKDAKFLVCAMVAEADF